MYSLETIIKMNERGEEIPNFARERHAREQREKAKFITEVGIVAGLLIAFFITIILI